MFKAYKKPTAEQLGVNQCANCECLILSDSSHTENKTKLEQYQNQKFQTSTDDESNDSLVLLPKCHETVKIFVKGAECENSCSQAAKQSKEEPVETKKRSWFQMLRKNREDPVEKCGDQSQGDAKMETSDVNLEDIIKNCSSCGKPGGCNTNTIIFPRDKSAGDGFASLETWLRMEAKANSRNLEDILSELHKQRREMHELKDMLDTIVRGIREQLFMTAFGKGRNEIFEDMKRQNNLERKSNTLSITKSIELQDPKETDESSTKPAEHQSLDKRKKRFFPWCK